MNNNKKICKECNFENLFDSKFCIKCGFKFVEKKCRYCGAELLENDNFCIMCGKPVEKKESEAAIHTPPETVEDEPQVEIADGPVSVMKPPIEMQNGPVVTKNNTSKLKITMDIGNGNTEPVSEGVKQYYKVPTDI